MGVNTSRLSSVTTNGSFPLVNQTLTDFLFRHILRLSIDKFDFFGGGFSVFPLTWSVAGTHVDHPCSLPLLFIDNGVDAITNSTTMRKG